MMGSMQLTTAAAQAAAHAAQHAACRKQARGKHGRQDVVKINNDENCVNHEN